MIIHFIFITLLYMSLKYLIDPIHKKNYSLNTFESRKILKNYINNLNYKNYIEKIKITNDTKYVLLGESSHGTNEYYNFRVLKTINLVEKHNFNCIFFEMEWSNGRKLDKFIKSLEYVNLSAKKFLISTFNKFPKWMWCNSNIEYLIDYLRKYNKKNKNKISIYGVDCQDIDLAQKDLNQNCSENNNSFDCIIVKKIIENYIEMRKPNSNYWNMRDTMWYNIIQKLLKENCDKFVLWAHNSHIGNASCYKENMNEINKLNIGYLIKNNMNKNQKLLIGFLTSYGTVRAAEKWNEPSKTIKLLKPIKDSYELDFEKLYKKKLNKDNIILYKTKKKFNKKLFKMLRYIGVIYNKINERQSHYSYTNIDCEFDYVVYFYKSNSIDLLK